MEEKTINNKRKSIILLVILAVILIGIGFSMIFFHDGYSLNNNYYLSDDNTDEEKVQSYLDQYLYNKYKQKFTLDFKKKEKRDFGSPVWGNLGVGKVDDIYRYSFEVNDENQISFNITYENGYKYRNKQYKPRIVEGYGSYLKFNSIISKTYTTYKITTDEKAYIYDKSFDVNKIKKIVKSCETYNKYIKIYVTNDDQAYNVLISKELPSLAYYHPMYIPTTKEDYHPTVSNMKDFEKYRKAENFYVVEIGVGKNSVFYEFHEKDAK